MPEYLKELARHVTRERAMRARNPHRVHVEDYMERMAAGRIARPEVLGGDSWVDRAGSRTFGFAREEDARAFRRRWRL